jgi:hypothetical protein
VARLVGLLVLYLVLDFANPLMPGAVCFEPGDSVEGTRAARDHARLAIPALPAAPPARPAPLVAPRLRPAARPPAPRRRAAPLRPIRRPEPGPPRAADPH